MTEHATPLILQDLDVVGAEESEEEVRRAQAKFLDRPDLRFHLLLKGTNTLVRSSGLHRIDWSASRCEIDSWIRTRLAGRGYATEAASRPSTRSYPP